MKRRLATLAAAVSLVLCMASVALWVAGAGQPRSVTIVTRGSTFYEFYATEGLGVTCVRQWPEPPGTRHLTFNELDELPLVLYSGFGGAFTRAWYHLGFGISSGRVCVAVDSNGVVLRGITNFTAGLTRQKLSPPLPYWKLDFPYAAPVVATAILPFWVCLRGIRKWFRTRHGHCPTCGYDLRATPDRCPECGTVRRAAATAAR